MHYIKTTFWRDAYPLSLDMPKNNFRRIWTQNIELLYKMYKQGCERPNKI